MESAQTHQSVLITEAGTFLGTELAKAYLERGFAVYGISHQALPHGILANKNFTLLEIDLSQPLPPYLPKFDIIFDLSILKHSKISLFSQMPTVPQQTENLVSHLGDDTKLFVISNIRTSEDLFDYLTRNEQSLKNNIKLLLVGDLYGPRVPQSEENELKDIIFQAAAGDKVVLEDEGLRYIYPAYIDDVVQSIVEIAADPQHKEIYHLISQRAKTSLTVAYELQDVARLSLNKELGLFFSGPQKQVSSEPEIMAGHDTKVQTDLKDGLKVTLQYLAAHSGEDVKKQEVANDRYRHPSAAFTVEEKKKKEYLGKLPKFNVGFNPRLRNIFLIVIAIMMLAIGKTALDLYLGASDLKSAKSSLEEGDFAKAKQKATGAQKSFHAASNKTKLISVLNGPIAALETGSAAASYFIDGSEIMSKNFYLITHPDSPGSQDKDNSSADFQKAAALSAYASEMLKDPRLKTASLEFSDLSHLSQTAYELANLMDEITAAGAKKTYLVLLQNNSELRPGGGFIGNYATIDFNQGKLGEIKVDDIYTIDGQLKEKIEPPKELKDKLGTTQLYLRDSNWSPDNTLNAQTEKELFKKETGKDVDGVITIDLSFMQDLLSAIGPIRLEDYKEDITDKNLFEKGEYYSEIGFFPGSTQKKDFFGALGRALIAKVMQNEKQESSSNSQLAIVKAVKNALKNKHIMLTFDSPNLSGYVATHGWNQPLPPLTFNPADDTTETRDLLAISEANVGANKVNRFISRKISYEMTIGRDADLVAKLKITYTNSSQADTWPGGKYTNFLRVYVPANSDLIEVKNGNETDIKSVQTLSQGYLTAFSTFVEVPVKSTKEIELTYRILKNIKLETTPTYHMYFSKQPGTDSDPLTFTFNLPQYLSIKSITSSSCHPEHARTDAGSVSGSTNCSSVEGKQNVKTETDLQEDKQFTINVSKK